MKISIVKFYRNIRKQKKIEQKFGKNIFQTKNYENYIYMKEKQKTKKKL